MLMVAVALLEGVPPSVANTVMKYEATSSLSRVILAFLVTIPEVGSVEQKEKWYTSHVMITSMYTHLSRRHCVYFH